MVEGRAARQLGHKWQIFSSFRRSVLGCPLPLGACSGVDVLHGHLGLNAFVQAEHSMPGGCLVIGLILLGAFVYLFPPARDPEDHK